MQKTVRRPPPAKLFTPVAEVMSKAQTACCRLIADRNDLYSLGRDYTDQNISGIYILSEAVWGDDMPETTEAETIASFAANNRVIYAGMAGDLKKRYFEHTAMSVETQTEIRDAIFLRMLRNEEYPSDRFRSQRRAKLRPVAPANTLAFDMARKMIPFERSHFSFKRLMKHHIEAPNEFTENFMRDISTCLLRLQECEFHWLRIDNDVERAATEMFCHFAFRPEFGTNRLSFE